MSVTWNWEDKVGVLHVLQNYSEIVKDTGAVVDEEKHYEVSLYKGNCMMVAIYEYPDDTQRYDFYTFFNDIAHAKRSLGLTKNYAGEKQNIYNREYDKWAGITILKPDKDLFKLCELCLEAFPKFTIDK